MSEDRPSPSDAPPADPEALLAELERDTAEALAKAKADAEAEARAAQPPEEAEAAAPVVEVSAPADETPAPEVDPPVVAFRNVTKTYGDGPKAFTAIKDLTFSVPDIPGKGEFICVLGPSGCGKSTVLRLIAGLGPQHPPTIGEVLVEGRPVTGPGADRGMVFQDYTSFDHMTVEDNVAFGLACRGVGKKERLEQAHHWIDKVGLSVGHDARKYPHQLSGGMRQRVAIARTLILKPRIILMDEPFGALDPSTRMQMQDNLVALWRDLEATVFFVTHSIEEAVYLGDRVHILSSSPGTLLREIQVPPPDRPAQAMQRDPEFLEYVFDIRDTIETLEASRRAGDD
ncbi:MAG: ABC transporter ATP-binding protein [Deltaproteobacteria bacterium]|nr:MAG: ABC transporter ATP-binding protein [Deltaproteobacteria bacterium]